MVRLLVSIINQNTKNYEIETLSRHKKGVPFLC